MDRPQEKSKGTPRYAGAIAALIALLLLATPAFGLESAVKEVRAGMDGCIETYGPAVLKFIGLQGGYAIWPDKTFEVDRVKVPYYFYEGEFIGPTLEKIENQISFLMNSQVYDCLSKKINGMEEKGVIVLQSIFDVSVDTEIDDADIRVTFNYPMTIIKEKKFKKLKEPVVVTYQVRLKEIYKIASDIQDPENPSGMLNMKYLYERPEGMKLTMHDTEEEETIIYEVVDEKARFGNEKGFTFFVANKIRPTTLEELYKRTLKGKK